MGYKDFKKGDRIKLVNLPKGDESYYEKYNIKVGDTAYFGFLTSEHKYYYITDKEGNKIGGNMLGLENEWILWNNDYNCKHECNPCKEKCEFFEEA
jgi:hypothetical protein